MYVIKTLAEVQSSLINKPEVPSLSNLWQSSNSCFFWSAYIKHGFCFLREEIVMFSTYVCLYIIKYFIIRQYLQTCVSSFFPCRPNLFTRKCEICLRKSGNQYIIYSVIWYIVKMWFFLFLICFLNQYSHTLNI